MDLTVFYIVIMVISGLGVLSIIVEYVRAWRARRHEPRICVHCGVKILPEGFGKRATNGGWLHFPVCSKPEEDEEDG